MRFRRGIIFLWMWVLSCDLLTLHAVASTLRRPVSPSLLTVAGVLNRNISPREIAGWKHELQRSDRPTSRKALLHLWLGEVEFARNREPACALAQFRQVQSLVLHEHPLYGLAAYDTARTLFYEGAYGQAAPAFHALVDPKTALSGYSRRECGLWYRHTAACAGYHAQRARLGITEPNRLDPLCGVAALAACLRAQNKPYDKRTLLSHCRMTGLGNNMADLRQCAKRLGMSAWSIKADEEGLKLLPLPLVAYVEQDHFVAVTRADKDGVSYLCSDCGAWPGGRRDLTWKQWRAMDCNLYLAVATPGSTEAKTLNAALTAHVAGTATTEPHIRLAALTGHQGLQGALQSIRALATHVLLFDPVATGCGHLPVSPQCHFQCCSQDSPPPAAPPSPGDGGGQNRRSGAGDGGPSEGDPVELATGEEHYNPPADLTVYNPIGPSVVWQRHYGSMRGPYQVPSGQFPFPSLAFGDGWTTSYDLQVIVANGTVALYYPNGANDLFSASAVPTAEMPQVTCPSMAAGVPTLCTWNYNSDGSYSFVFTQADRSQWLFSSRNGYALSQITDRNGNYINFVYGTASNPGYSLAAITDSKGQLLLSIHHNAGYHITSISDRYGRSVYYTLVKPHFRVPLIGATDVALTQVSQVVRTGATLQPWRYTYGYLANNNGVNELDIVLHTITVPSPTGRGTATATINYNGIYVGSVTDANGNTRTYTPVDANDTQVTVTDKTGKVVTSYTVGFDSQMRTTYRTDATNKTQVFQAAYHADNPNQPYQVTNANNQTTTYTYDSYGQVQTVTSPRGVVTTYTYDYTHFPLGELKQVQEGTKSPFVLSYYEPSGLVKTISTPLPGTSGGAQTAVRSFTYDSLGNVLTIQLPGNDATASMITTFNYATDGSYSQAPAMAQPLTVTDNLSHVTHYRYDVRGNQITIVDALGNRTDNQYNLANQLTQTLAPAVGDITNSIGASRSALTYNATTKTYDGTLKLTNNGSSTLQGSLLLAFTNLPPGVKLANASGTYVNSPALVSAPVNLTAGSSTTLNVSFQATSASVVSYGVQTYLTDSLGNPLAQRSATRRVYLYPGGPLRSMGVYDESGALYRQINYGRGSEGELLSVSGSAEPVTYTYDANYRLQSLTDGNGHATQYAYNPAGWLQSVTYPLGDGIQYASYDPMGHLTKRIDGRGIETDYTYNDPESKLTNIQYVNNANYPNVNQYNITIGYDGYGRRQDVHDFSGHTHYAYDDLDNQTEIDTTYNDANGHGLPTVALTYGFYANDSRQSMTVQTGSTTYNWNYHYDNAGRPLSLVSPFSETTQWSFLPNNWLASQQYANGVTANYAYNRRGFLNDLTYYKPGIGLLSDFRAIVYDVVANPLTRTTSVPSAASSYSGVTSYNYDIRSQLTREQSSLGNGFTEDFLYDQAGNPKVFKGRTHSFNSNNQVTDAGFGYDGNGNPTTYNGIGLSFDPENHLIVIGSALSAGYRFDGMRAWNQSGVGRTYTIYDGIESICELDGKGTITEVNTFGKYGLLSRYTGSSSVFYTFDPQGSTVQRLDPSGVSVTTSLFDAFGEGSSNGLPDSFGYGAQWSYVTESSTKFLLLGHRYYDANTGRFLTRDPVSYSGGIDLYAYVNNRASFGYDPTGFSCETICRYLSYWDTIVKCGLVGLGVGTVATPLSGFAAGALCSYVESEFWAWICSGMCKMPCLKGDVGGQGSPEGGHGPPPTPWPPGGFEP